MWCIFYPDFNYTVTPAKKRISNGDGMFNPALILAALAILISGCTAPQEKQITSEKEPETKAVQKKSSSIKKDQEITGIKLCENIKSLKKGMTLEEVHSHLEIGDNKKYAFTRPIFYIKCYEEDMIIAYAQHKFFFNEGCTFRKYYPPAEKEMEKMICSGSAGELGPPEIFRY